MGWKMTLRCIDDFIQFEIPYKTRLKVWHELHDDPKHIYYARPKNQTPNNPLYFYRELFNWLERHMMDDVWIWDRHFNGGLVFKSKKDAMLFKLKWGG